MHILFLLHSDIRQEQRANKELETLLGAGHTLALIDFPLEGLPPANLDGLCDHRPLRLWTRGLPKNQVFWPIKYFESLIRFLIQGLKTQPDVVHCVDRLTLPAGWAIARLTSVPFIYDTQEIWAEVKSALNRPRRLWLWIERSLGKLAYKVLVTDHFRRNIISEILQLNSADILVIMNLPKLSYLRNGNRNIRIDSGFIDKKLIVYAGGLSGGRHLEESILALLDLPEMYALAFVGFGNDGYKRQLLDLAKEAGIASRFVILPAVRWSDIPEYIRSADCALALYEKLSINNLYCSPSKLFDAVIAGVPVVGTDNPLIVEVLCELDAGKTIDRVTPPAIAQAVKELLTDSNAKNRRACLAENARARYTWESQEQILIGCYTGMEQRL